MKTITVLLFSLSCSISLLSQNSKFNVIDSSLVKETANFIDKFNKSDPYFSKYAVFVMRGFESDSSQNSFCFSMSYILNAFNYDMVEPVYYFKLNKSLVLISMSTTFDINVLDVFLPKKIGEEDKIMIMNTFYPGNCITYSANALIYCQTGKKITATFFEDSDQIPREKSIIRNTSIKRNKRIK